MSMYVVKGHLKDKKSLPLLKLIEKDLAKKTNLLNLWFLLFFSKARQKIEILIY